MMSSNRLSSEVPLGCAAGSTCTMMPWLQMRSVSMTTSARFATALLNVTWADDQRLPDAALVINGSVSCH